jgi:uncharacterized protein YgbK (DUF1537 family)
LNPVSLEQIRELGSSNFKRVYLEPDFLNSSSSDSGQDNGMIEEILQALPENRDLLISSTTSREELHDYFNRKYGSSVPGKVYAEAANRLGEFIAGIIEKAKFGTVLIVGGDTLMALIRTMTIQIIYPLRELIPGTVLSKMEWKNKWIYLITKPGGYGEKDTLLKIINHIKISKE